MQFLQFFKQQKNTYYIFYILKALVEKHKSIVSNFFFRFIFVLNSSKIKNWKNMGEKRLFKSSIHKRLKLIKWRV